MRRAIPRVVCRAPHVEHRLFHYQSKNCYLSLGSTTPPHAVAPQTIIRTGWRSFSSENVVVPVPTMGDSITEGVINKWQKAVGEHVEADEVVAIIDTDKVSVDINSPQSGLVVEHKAAEGDTVDVGAALFVLQPGAASAGGEAPKSAPAAAAPDAAAAPPSPKEAAKPDLKETPPKPSPAAAPSPSPISVDRTEFRTKMTPIRKRIASRLKEAQNSAASLTTFNEVDMGNLMAIRSEAQDNFVKQHGIKLGLMSPFLFAAGRALKKMPACNAQIEGNEIVNRNYVDISVAVATPSGLLVPVMKDCDKKSIAELERVSVWSCTSPIFSCFSGTWQSRKKSP
eukprot:GHVN01040276.1.p1 GENE.GHVN01040276.1~~GHVN01040276.1.p1  ORF type:complete len:340 (+),score=41.60 GHVN01040276.1:101-1120(+)